MLETQPIVSVTKTAPIHLVACPRPFSVDRVEGTIEEGLPIADVFRRIGLNPDPIFARVFIDGQLIPKVEWEWTVPKAGQFVTIRVIPTGGQGGGKDALRIVAMIGVIAAAMFAPAALGALGVGGLTTSTGAVTFTGALVSATVSIAGSLAVNALIPPSKQNLNDLSGLGNSSPTLSLTGSSNQLAPYAPIPRVYGRHRIYPPLAARPFTEIVGSDQHLRLLFCCGYGPLAVSDMKIGQTPIEQFVNVEMEVRYGFPTDAPLTIIPDDVFEDALSILLTNAGSWQQRTSQANAKELSVDVVFPAGLINLDLDPSSFHSVVVNVEYRIVGDVSWTQANAAGAVQAAVTTAFAGSNNDLVVTARDTGDAGNMIALAIYSGDTLTVQQNPTNGRGFFVTIVDGVTTGSALAAALAADAAFNSLCTVANAPGNNGTGTISGMDSELATLYQLTGGTGPNGSFQFDGHDAQLVRGSLRWKVSVVGQYEVRLRRVSADNPQGTIRDLVYWSMLRTIQSGVPIAKSGLCLIAMRIKATDQLNGTVDQFNCVAESLLLDWTGSTWTSRPTSNPAAIYRDILQGSANARPLADSRLDLTAIQGFSERCAAAGFEFNQVVDYRTTVYELSRDVLAAGRGSFGMKDGKYSVVEERAQTTPVQHFTPRNSWGYRGMKTFVDLPHALKVRFVNPDKDWQQDERYVYADGYSTVNATKFETLDVPGVTSSEQAWKLGRYHLAVASLRPETHEFTTDVENLVCTRGDLIRIVHDVPQFGAAYGRIKALATDGGGNATGFTMDDVFTMAAGTNYAVRFRKADGSSLVQQINTVAGEQSTFTFTAPISAATKPAVGDLCLLGVLDADSVQLIVKSIEPGPDLMAKLTCVDYAPAVLTADSGPIPAFDSQITLPVTVPPPVPFIVQVQSDETVLQRDVDGSFQSRIVVSMFFGSGFRLPVEKVEVQYRLTGSTGAWRQLFAPVSGTSIDVTIAPVEDGAMYDLRLRSVDEAGGWSDWATVDAHTVVGKTTPPPDVPILIFDGDLLRWSYPDPPRDLAGFIVKSRPGTDAVWNEGTTLHDHLVANLYFPLVTDAIVRVFMIKAVDVAGNESANATSIIYPGGPLVIGNLAHTIDERAAGFPGTKSNCTVVSGDLKADGSTLFYSNDDATMFTDDTALFYVGIYKTMTYTWTVTPSSNWLNGKLRISLGITAGSWSLKYRPDAQNLFYTTDSALFYTDDAALMFTGSRPDFMTWPGAIGPMTLQSYEFELEAGGGAIQAVVTALAALFDMPDINETFDNLAIPVGGRRLPIAKQYQYIKSVQITPQTTGRIPSIADKDYLAGPFVELHDLVDAPADGVADVAVVGF